MDTFTVNIYIIIIIINFFFNGCIDSKSYLFLPYLMGRFTVNTSYIF